MIKRILAVLAILLIGNCAAAAQESQPKPGGAPGGTQPAAGGGAVQPGGQPSLPGGLGGGSGSPGGLGGAGQAGGGANPGGLTGKGPVGSGLGGNQPGPGIGAPGSMMSSPGGGGGGKFTKEKDLKDMTLEDLLAKALKDNPDIRVAESKVREAEANLNRSRLEVLQKVARLKQEIHLARILLNSAETSKLQIVRMGATAAEKDRMDAQLAVERAKGELAKLEAELPYLVGKQPAGMPGMSGGGSGAGMMGPGGASGIGFRDPVTGRDSPMDLGQLQFTLELNAAKTVSDKLHKALDTEVTIRQGDLTLHDAVSCFVDKLQGINVTISDKKLLAAKVNMNFIQPVTLGAVFQFFEDELDCKCVIREYGIVIVQRDRVPPGAAPLLDFWKKSRAVESKPK